MRQGPHRCRKASPQALVGWEQKRESRAYLGIRAGFHPLGYQLVRCDRNCTGMLKAACRGASGCFRPGGAGIHQHEHFETGGKRREGKKGDRGFKPEAGQDEGASVLSAEHCVQAGAGPGQPLRPERMDMCCRQEARRRDPVVLFGQAAGEAQVDRDGAGKCRVDGEPEPARRVRLPCGVEAAEVPCAPALLGRSRKRSGYRREATRY